MACELCRTSPKYWEGDPRKCAFEGRPPADNWNCATLVKLRTLLEERTGQDPRIRYLGAIDQHYYLIDALNMDVEEGKETFAFVWISYYKSRGRTECAHALGDMEPRWLTEAEVLALIKMLEV